MNKLPYYFIYIIVLASILSCSKNEAVKTIPPNCDNEAALSTCLSPKFSPAYYEEQGVKYFLTMQSDIPINVIPNYSDLVIRWEWPPWLLLTGYKRDFLIASDILLKLNPTKYDTIECKYFEQQPFCRCHVIFNYSGEPCPIYEEFTFNDQGEITFIEAWSDFESLLPMGKGSDGVWDEADYWATKEVNRLSTKVPGLGNATGRIDVNSQGMKDASRIDNDVAELVRRLKDPVKTYFEQLINFQEELKHGCETPLSDTFPYYQP